MTDKEKEHPSENNEPLVEGKHTALYRGTKPVVYNENEDGTFTKVDSAEQYTLHVRLMDEPPETFNMIIQALCSAEAPRELLIKISSRGGLVSQGVEYLDIIENKFLMENTTTQITGHAHSMAAILFGAGGSRIVNRGSTLMLHNYSGGTRGKGGEMIDYIEHADKAFNAIIGEYFVTPGYISKTEIENLRMGKELWFTADEMLRRGMATHITLYGKMYSAEEYIDGSVKKILKKANKSIQSNDPSRKQHVPIQYSDRN